MEEKNNESGLSIMDILNMLKRKIVLIVVFVLVFLFIGLGYGLLTDKTTYHATSNIYVIYDNGSTNVSTDSINYGRLAPKTFSEALNSDDKFWKLIEEEANKNNLELAEDQRITVPTYVDIGKSIKATYDTDLQSLQFSFTYSSRDKDLIVPMTKAVISVLNDITSREEGEDKTTFNCFTIQILGDTEEKDIYETSKSKVKIAILFSAIGLLVGVCSAFCIELFSQTLRSKEQFEDICDIKVIGIVPSVQSIKKTEDKK